MNKIRFKEICETVPGINNKSLVVKFVRLGIRYVTRIAGYSLSIAVIDCILRYSAGTGSSRVSKYLLYILKINRHRLTYLDCLSKNDLFGAVQSKNIWAETTSKDSMSRVSRCTSREYLSLLSYNGLVDSAYKRSSRKTIKRSNKKFYIYGPNAKSNPRHEYKDYTLVLTKPLDIDTSKFKDKRLFINSSYFNEVVTKDCVMSNRLIEEFGIIYVHCRESNLSKPFKRAKFPLGDNIASPMALGKVLHNLIQENGKFSCVIEGFDFYLDKNSYQGYYPSLARQSNNSISEQIICSGLANHDTLYNFLYVKKQSETLNILGSIEFKKILKMNGEEYLSEISKTRNFRSLGYL